MSLPKDFAEFQIALQNKAPDHNWPEVLKALWYDAKGDWQRAHELVDPSSEPMAKWIHAYLHRKEGDEWNAGYWYRLAGKKFSKMALEEEWQTLVEKIIDN